MAVERLGVGFVGNNKIPHLCQFLFRRLPFYSLLQKVLRNISPDSYSLLMYPSNPYTLEMAYR